MDKPLSKMTVEELRVERDTLWDKINAVLAGAVAGDEGQLNHSLMLVAGELLDRGEGWIKTPRKLKRKRYPRTCTLLC